jgi:predicted Zn-dependent peptidase
MLDRTIAPPFNRSTSFELIQPHKKILKGGAEIYFVLGGTQEVCKIEVVFPAGRWVEKAWGAAYFASNLLPKGTKTKSSYDIAHQLDFYGSHLEIHAGLDFVSVSLYILNKNFEAALNVFLELLTQSILPSAEFELLKSIYLQNLKVNYEKTSFQASKLMRKHLFGDIHPYGKELEENDVKMLAHDSVVKHYSDFFKAGTIIVSGRVTDKNQLLLEEAFSFLAYNAVERKHLSNDGQKYLRDAVSKEGSVQSSIRLAKKAMSKTDPDYIDALFLNHILGGYFGSRLMKNIREEKGLSYGISSSLHALKNDSYLVIGADVNSENVSLAFDEIGKELNRLRIEKIDEEELTIARNHFIGSLQLEITTSFAHADKIKNIILFNLSPQYYQNMIVRVDAITAEDLMRTADRYFAENSFIEIAVG